MKMVEKILRLIDERGWTQTAFESMAGLAKNRITKWIDGQGEPKASQAGRMARLLGVTTDYLVRDDLDDPAAIAGLSEDDRMILRTIHAVGLDADEVIRLIHEGYRNRATSPDTSLNAKPRTSLPGERGGDAARPKGRVG